MNGFYLYQNINDFQHTFLSGMAYSPVLALIDVYVSLKSLCTSWRNREKKKHIICKKNIAFILYTLLQTISQWAYYVVKVNITKLLIKTEYNKARKMLTDFLLDIGKKSSNLHTWLWEWERIWDPIKIENHIRCDNTHFSHYFKLEFFWKLPKSSL